MPRGLPRPPRRAALREVVWRGLSGLGHPSVHHAGPPSRSSVRSTVAAPGRLCTSTSTVRSMGQTIELQAADGAAEAYLTGTRATRGCCSTSTRSGCGRRSRRWPTGSRRGGTSCWRRTSSTATARPRSWRRPQDLREAGSPGGVLRQRGGRPGAGLTRPTGPRRTPTRGCGPCASTRGDGPIGVTGYCMGARLAVRTAGQFPGTVAAVGGFHGGGLVTDADDSPHLAIAGQHRGVRLRPRRQRPGDAAGERRRAGGDLAGRRAAAPQRDLRGRPARLHDERHLDVPGGGGRAALQGARGTARAHAG